jgi:hypothetical protein
MKKALCLKLIRSFAEDANAGMLNQVLAVRSAIEDVRITDLLRRNLSHACTSLDIYRPGAELDGAVYAGYTSVRDREWKSGALLLIACMTEVASAAED